jgi:hypothetical protein
MQQTRTRRTVATQAQGSSCGYSKQRVGIRCIHRLLLYNIPVLRKARPIHPPHVHKRRWQGVQSIHPVMHPAEWGPKHLMDELDANRRTGEQ